MNHVLQYTQLKFKLDPLMKPEILGSIPSGVANLWTITRSTGRRDSLSNERKICEKKCGLIFEFWKIRPRGGTVLLWSRHLLLFLFLSGENQVRTKNPNDSSMEKSGLRKLDFWVRGSDYLSGRDFI